MAGCRPQISFEEFKKVDLRVGRVVRCEVFAEARKPAYKLWIDFGPEIGTKRSSAQITTFYSSPEELIGKQVICVVNLGSRQIANFVSEVLTTGFYREESEIVLSTTDAEVPLGQQLC